MVDFTTVFLTPHWPGLRLTTWNGSKPPPVPVLSMMTSSNGTIPRYWPFVWEIHRSPVNSPHKVQWRGALIFSLICARVDGWVNNREAGDMRRHVSARIQTIVSWVRNEMESDILFFCHCWYLESLVFIKYVQKFYRNSANNFSINVQLDIFCPMNVISIHYSLLL